ncbi:MAG TPA: dienelactone hydrolase family protein [Acidimicrobiia bacterium]|nr:dienelactone hydrolase family protein [Acidimicrobiia bacterium]
MSGAAVDTRHLELIAPDGQRLQAFEALGDGGASVLVLPDVRGLYRFYEELAARFAEQGHNSVAIDYFSRSAGTDDRDDDFDYMPHVRQTTFETIKADAAAGVTHLRELDPDRPVFTVGFCFGGSNSWHQAANGLGLAGAIGFYGHPNRESPEGATPLVERVDQIECPILGLMGGADPGIPQDEVDRWREALTAAGVENDIVVYEGAPHSFFDRKYEEFADESSDAWSRCLEFIAQHS